MDLQVSNHLYTTGFYNRAVLADGDTMTVDFANGVARQTDLPFTARVTWQITPGTGATVTGKYVMRPDYAAADFLDHPSASSMTRLTRGGEEGHLAALRFATSGGTATFECWSLTQVVIS